MKTTPIAEKVKNSQVIGNYKKNEIGHFAATASFNNISSPRTPVTSISMPGGLRASRLVIDKLNCEKLQEGQKNIRKPPKECFA